MDVRTMQKNAIDNYLKLVRFPIDVATRGSDSAELAIDRFDASIRAFTGRLIGNEQLVHDAERRRAAADERERAAVLKAEAAERRAETEAKAEQKREQVREQEQKAKQQVDEVSQRRKTSAQKAKQRTEQAIASEAREERLEQLDRKAEVLDEQEKALATAEEAVRLDEAAAATKAARKRA